MKKIMNKYLWLIVVCLVMIATSSGSADRVFYADIQTGSALISTGWTEFHGIVATGDGTNAITVDIYDNTSAAGSKIVPTITFAQSATTKTQAYGVSTPVQCRTGIYVNVSVAGAGTVSYTVYYSK